MKLCDKNVYFILETEIFILPTCLVFHKRDFSWQAGQTAFLDKRDVNIYINAKETTVLGFYRRHLGYIKQQRSQIDPKSGILVILLTHPTRVMLLRN